MLRVDVMKGSSCDYQAFVLRTASVVSCQKGHGHTCDHVTFSWRLCWNCFTSWEDWKNKRTLDSPNWEFAVIKLSVYLLQSPVFLSSKSELCNCLYIRQNTKALNRNVLLWTFLTKVCDLLPRGYMVTLVTVTILSVTQRICSFIHHLSHFWAKVLYLKGFREIHPSLHLSHISPVISPVIPPVTPPFVSLGSARRIPYYK